jgi:sugar lactone lactonase YvrE
MNSAFECVLDIKASLGECPVWSVEQQALHWVDINAPSLNRFDPLTGRNAAWAMPTSIGCFALRQSGGFIAALRNGFWLVDRHGKLESRICEAPYDPAHHRLRRPGRPARTVLGREHEREARCELREALPSRSRLQADRDGF